LVAKTPITGRRIPCDGQQYHQSNKYTYLINHISAKTPITGREKHVMGKKTISQINKSN
jgi:hypothetical protein